MIDWWSDNWRMIYFTISKTYARWHLRQLPYWQRKLVIKCAKEFIKASDRQ